MEFAKNLLSKIKIQNHHYTHAGMFVLGVFLTFGLVGLDGLLNTTDYKKSGAASVVRSMEEVQKEREEAKREEEVSTTTEAMAEEEEVLDEEDVVADISSDEEQEIELIVEAPPEYTEPETSLAETEESSEASQAAVQQALDEAQELLENLTQNQSPASSDEEVVFVTPTGVKIDADGNVISEDGTVEQASASTQTESITLPEGVYALPNGNLVYANGTPYTGSVSNTVTYVQPDPVNDYYTSPSGAVFDRQGNLISLPEKEKEEVTPPTVIDPNNLPADGDTVYIPQSVKLWLNNNPQLSCSLNFFNNERELCNLFKDKPTEYEWVAVDTD